MTTKLITSYMGSKVYVMKRDKADDTPNVVISTFSIHSYPLTVLFNSSVGYSFVAFGIVDKLKLVPLLGLPPIYVTTPIGGLAWYGSPFRECLILIYGKNA